MALSAFLPLLLPSLIEQQHLDVLRGFLNTLQVLCQLVGVYGSRSVTHTCLDHFHAEVADLGRILVPSSFLGLVA